MDKITSSKNPKIQQVRALLNKREEREQTGRFVIEGVRLSEEALAAGWLPELVLVSPSLSARGLELTAEMKKQNVPVEQIDQALLDRLSDTQTSPGILAVIPRRQLQILPVWDLLLVLDGLRDPGNLGTILRSATAVGVHACLLTPGTTDPFAPKVVRAAMGAHFRLQIMTVTWEEIRSLAKRRSARILIADSTRGEVCWNADLRVPLVLVIGGEAEGAHPEAYNAADGLIHIPMPGMSESLNAAIAASVLLFEILRQRSR